VNDSVGKNRNPLSSTICRSKNNVKSCCNVSNLRPEVGNKHGCDVVVGVNKAKRTSSQNNQQRVNELYKLADVVHVHPKSNFALVVLMFRVTYCGVATFSHVNFTNFITQTNRAHQRNCHHVEVVHYTRVL
jgi:hypothetical protein